MFLIVLLEVGVEAHEGGGGDGVALASDYILRRVELGEVVSEEKRTDGRGEESVCEVGRQAAQRVGHGGGGLGRPSVGLGWVNFQQKDQRRPDMTGRSRDTSCVLEMYSVEISADLVSKAKAGAPLS
jgi:hypothetical protein